MCCKKQQGPAKYRNILGKSCSAFCGEGINSFSCFCAYELSYQRSNVWLDWAGGILTVGHAQPRYWLLSVSAQLVLADGLGPGELLVSKHRCVQHRTLVAA